MKIDFAAGGAQMIDHMAPIYHALPKSMRGTFHVRIGLVAHAARRGIKATQTRIKAYGHGSIGPVVVANPASLREATRAGRSVILMTHSSGDTLGNGELIEPSYLRAPGEPAAQSCENVILFLAPGRHIAEHFRDVWPDIPVAEIGCPKLDPWHRDPPKRDIRSRPTVCVSFTWDWMANQSIRGAWKHYRSGMERLKRGPWRLIGNAHMRMKPVLAPQYRELGIETEWDFERIMREADVFVTDRSSTLWEFASIGKPVVVLNAPWYYEVKQESLRFWKAAHVGLHCEGPDELPGIIERALEDPEEVRRQREDAVDYVYTVHDGTAAETAVEAILEVIERGLPKGPTREEIREQRRLIRGGVDLADAQNFPQEFEIEMLRGVFAPKRRVEEGEILRVPRDVSRLIAIRWCTRRKPWARVVQTETVDVTMMEGPNEIVEVSEVGNVATFDAPELEAPGLDSLPYSKLQELARERGIKANQKRADLIKALVG